MKKIVIETPPDMTLGDLDALRSMVSDALGKRAVVFSRTVCEISTQPSFSVEDAETVVVLAKAAGCKARVTDWR